MGVVMVHWCLNKDCTTTSAELKAVCKQIGTMYKSLLCLVYNSLLCLGDIESMVNHIRGVS